MSLAIQKVTAFITRRSEGGHELLLLEHPYAGIQIPAGTVEKNETPEQAVLREAAEETGLDSLSIFRYLGRTEETLPAEQRIIADPTAVFVRPDVTSSDWAYLRRGIAVRLNRYADGFAQVTYEEFDNLNNPQYVTLNITGWVPVEVLAENRQRHFFQLENRGHPAERWTVFADHHHFSLFWAPLTALPTIIPPQNEWLEFLGSQYQLPVSG
jgi:8-oxo-dGTP pyrophosphatase MutT (NUDIX family)